MARPAGNAQTNFPSSRPGIVFHARARERARNDSPSCRPPGSVSSQSAEKTLLLPARIADPREIDAAQMADFSVS